jgi:pimeloyl-ACP methyl ester carboxylesterase
MLHDLRIEPVLLTRDGVRLAHFEAGPSAPKSPPLLLINGWTGDHGIFTPQIAHFAKSRRVVAVDLRGHGASDAPVQEYTLPGFADDIAWQSRQLGLQKPVVIGHSVGGAITLELCGRHPDLASSSFSGPFTNSNGTNGSTTVGTMVGTSAGKLITR